jgi:hypothetical protein
MQRIGNWQGGKDLDSRLDSRNGRRYTPLRSITTARLTPSRGEGGIASPKTLCIGLTGKHRRKDGGNDDEKGQGEDCEPVHGEEDVACRRGEEEIPWRNYGSGMPGMINGRADAFMQQNVGSGHRALELLVVRCDVQAVQRSNAQPPFQKAPGSSDGHRAPITRSLNSSTVRAARTRFGPNSAQIRSP